MQEGNYIKLYRSIMDWDWYHDVNTCRLYIHMILKANWREGSFRGTTVPRGSFISSIGKLSDETSLTEREIRTAISHLKKTGELTVKTTNKYSVFTVKNYNQYQIADKQDDKQLTDNRHSNDILTTTIEERKKKRREEGKNKNIMCAADANALFESLWKLYPEKKGKERVSDSKKLKLLEIGFDEMSRSIDRYKTELEKDKDWRKPQNGSTFFNGGYVDYLDENYAPGGETRQKKSGFNSFAQHDYDFEAIERALTGGRHEQTRGN